MNSQNTAKLIIFIVAFVAITIFCCNQGWTSERKLSPSSRRTPPPNVLPPPRPTQQLWPEASFYKWVSKDVVKEFKNNGLEVEDVKPGYTLSPLTPIESTIFLMPSFGKNIGGYVSSYNSEDNLKKTKKHYLQMNKNSESPAWWIFEKDNILLLISGKVPEEKAMQYEKALNEMDKK